MSANEYQEACVCEARRNFLEMVKERSPSKAGHFEKAYSTNGLRAAITAHCLYCTDFDVSSIRDCVSYTCPLRNVRPYQNMPTEKASQGCLQAEGCDHESGII